MSLTLGARVGPYANLATISVGGMGEVYRARKTTLKCDVARKVLTERFTAGGARMARFQRRAEVLASLDHTNSGSIYSSVESPGTQALVLALVDGLTLDEHTAAALCQWQKFSRSRSRSSPHCLCGPGILTSAKRR